MPNILIKQDMDTLDALKADLLKIAAFYNLEQQFLPLLPDLNLRDYAEIVFCENGFELITGGKGDDTAKVLAETALRHGLPQQSVNYFLGCAKVFPGANLGMKLCFGSSSSLPSLYVRTKTDIEHGFAFLEKITETKLLQEIKNKLKDNKVLYGLGFSNYDGKLLIKTYTLGPVLVFSEGKQETGFISLRIKGNEIQNEIKKYLPDASLDRFIAPNRRWEEIRSFLRDQLKISKAGHIGVINNKSGEPEYKIYVEKTGAIKTDFEAK